MRKLSHFQFFKFAAIIIPLFGSPLGVFASDDEKLKLIIDNVKQNEKLYENIDVDLITTYTTGDRKPAVMNDGKTSEIIDSSIKTRYVHQGKLFRIDTTGSDKAGDAVVRNRDRIRAYDGKQTKLLHQKTVGNIIFNETTDDQFVRPHMMLIRNMRMTVPLSTYLSGHEAMKSHPDGRWNNSLKLSVTYKAEHVYKSHHCHEIWVTTLLDSGEPHDRWELWLAEEKNYIPIRMISYTFLISKSEPVSEGEVTELAEIKPGVWFPISSTVEAVDQMLLGQKGERRFGWRFDFTVPRVALHPNYPLEYFKDVEFPNGTAVYEIENSKVKRGYRVGTPGSPGASKSKINTIITLNVLIVSSILCFLKYKYKKNI